MVSYLRLMMPIGGDGRDVPLKSSLQCTDSILSPLASLRPSVPFSPLLSFAFCLLFHPQNSYLGTGRSTTAVRATAAVAITWHSSSRVAWSHFLRPIFFPTALLCFGRAPHMKFQSARERAEVIPGVNIAVVAQLDSTLKSRFKSAYHTCKWIDFYKV